MDIVEQIRKEPKQLHFDAEQFPPLFMIKEEYLTTCNEAFTWIDPIGGAESGTISKAVDHPAFAALRLHLELKGFIEVQRGWINGDRVIKPFYLNKVYFDVGEKFVSSSAMYGHLKYRKKYGNEFR
jgi:hypothetical protein